MDTQSVITHTVRVAGGRFAPGHLGELTQHIPFEMIDESLRETGTVQSRLRDLPSRVVVYLLLAACLFPETGYLGVWRKLTGALAGLPVAAPSASALAQARRRIGSKPLQWLFDLLKGPAADGRAPGTRWHGLLVVALDGTIMTVPDSPAVLTRFTKQAGNHGGTGYPQVRLLALVACGTRTLIDAVFGPTTAGETTYAPRLLPSLRPGMILLADRNFAAQKLVAGIAATGAHALVRLKNGRKMPVLTRYRDGSYLSALGPLRVRVVDCEITVTTASGKHTGLYRLATTLLDHHRHPAGELATLYHQRWDIETAYLELKSTVLGGRVLRARTPDGITQEIYALLVVYQLLRTAMADATGTQRGTDPDRAASPSPGRPPATRSSWPRASSPVPSSTSSARSAGTSWPTCCPHGGCESAPRIVKRAISKYQARGPPASTGPATRPPPASKSSRAQALDNTHQPQTSRPWF
ncbi:IS4 family transposase [Streptomyces cinereospinus]